MALQSFSAHRDLYLLGDFNIGILSQQGKTLLQCVSDNGLQQLIDGPTRTTASSASAVDLMFVPDTAEFLDSGMLLISFTDHNLVYCFKNTKVSKKPQVYQI